MDPSKPTLDDLRIERDAKKPGSPIRTGPIVIGLILLTACAGIIWWLTRPKPIEVRTALVRELTSGSSDRTVLNASGYVTARRAATVSSKVTGKVIEVLVEEGLQVKEGQVLARLDSSNVQKSLRLSQAQLDSATKGLEETKANLEQ